MTCLTKLAIPMVAALCASAALGAADPVKPAFDPANFAAPKPNPYFPLDLGQVHKFKGTHTDGDPTVETSVTTVQGAGPVILGVPTVMVLDEAFADGVIVERTLDYYAYDRDGNVWYFGEDVTNFRYDASGKLTGTDSKSAWRAGVNGAEPGISLTGTPSVGLTQFQEYAMADGAMDYAEVKATDVQLAGPSGSYSDVLKVFESSTVETDLREFKYFARGVGLIRADEELSPSLDQPAAVIELQP